MDAGTKLILQRLRETLSATMSAQRHHGNNTAFVVVRRNGSVLSSKSGTFEYSLDHALEVGREFNFALAGGDRVMSKSQARVEVIKALGGLAAHIDRGLAGYPRGD